MGRGAILVTIAMFWREMSAQGKAIVRIKRTGQMGKMIRR